jgi:flagella basal body P-ring formation protein FlgA
MMEKTHSRTRLLKTMLPTLAAGLAAAASVAAAPLAGDARAAVDKFLQAQVAGLPGKASIRVEAPGSGPLPACDALEAFLPRGAAAWGRVSVGLRCHSDQKPWTRFVLAHVAVEGRYFVAVRNIETGQAFGPGDFAARNGDLTALPRSVVTDAAELQGVVSGVADEEGQIRLAQ